MNENQNKVLWIFPNFLETINELPDKQRADVWRAVCEYGLGHEIDIKKFKTSQKMAIKMLIPLLKLRNTGGSVKEGEVRNKTGNNQFNQLSDCNNYNVEDNHYPNPKDNSKDNPKDNPEDNSLITGTRTRTRKEYKFNGNVIKLTPKDFDNWCKAYEHLNLWKELTELDKYYEEHNVSDWFYRCSQALFNKNNNYKKKEEQEIQQVFNKSTDWWYPESIMELDGYYYDYKLNKKVKPMSEGVPDWSLYNAETGEFMRERANGDER